MQAWSLMVSHCLIYGKEYVRKLSCEGIRAKIQGQGKNMTESVYIGISKNVRGGAFTGDPHLVWPLPWRLSDRVGGKVAR